MNAPEFAASPDPAANGPECIVVLRATGRRLAKMLHGDGQVAGYDSAKQFDAFTTPAPDLAALLELLRRLLPRPDCCVIRGELRAGETAAGIRRLLHPDKETGDAATVHDVPRRWLALDMEGVTLPRDVPAADLARCAQIAVATLPAAFDGAACIVQASASHGFRPDLRLRLWVWLSRPAWGYELKRWLRDTPADPSVFGAVQPIYTAAPLLAPGVADPIPQRLLFLPGDPVVDVPAPELLAHPTPRAPGSTTPIREAHASGYVRAALIRAAHRISTTAHPGRHPTIVGETTRLARFVAGGWLTQSVIADVVRRAALAAGKDDAAEIDACIAWGLENPWTGGPMPRSNRNG